MAVCVGFINLIFRMHDLRAAEYPKMIERVKGRWMNGGSAMAIPKIERLMIASKRFWAFLYVLNKIYIYWMLQKC